MEATHWQRRYDIDWIRVIAFDLLIFYHIGMFFVPWAWHLKNNEVSQALTVPMQFLNQWRLPLLFIISGMSSGFTLSFRTGGEYIKERFRRLVVPLLFGSLVIVAPQVYVERLSQGINYQSFFDFYPDYFNGIYPRGNFSWHHLWFLPYLFFYSVVFTPLLLFLQKNPTALRWLASVLVKYPFSIYLFIILIIIQEALMRPFFPTTLAFIGDWYTLTFYSLFFLYGFILVSLKDAFWLCVERILFASLGFGILFFILLQWAHQYELNFYLIVTIRIINLWSWIIVIFGLSAKYLNKPSPVLRYRSKAVYPFYILHQTLILLVGYALIDFDISIYLKFLILVTTTFSGCWIIYEFVIRKISVLHPFFGLRIE